MMQILISIIIFFLTQFYQIAEKTTPLVVKIMNNPQPLNIAGDRWIYYEMEIYNNCEDTLVMTGIEVYQMNKKIFSVSSDNLNQYFNKSTNLEKFITLCPGQKIYGYFEVGLNKMISEGSFQHKIKFGVNKFPFDNQEYFTGGTFTLDSNKIIQIGPPLKGGSWVAIYNAKWDLGHRRKQFTVNGNHFIPGRYAIDYFKVNSIDQFSENNSDSIQNWYGYNEDVLAVSNGVIMCVSDSVAENQLISTHIQPDAKNAAGNFVVIKIDENIFAFYEHLKPGSIRVKVGDTVEKGDVIASVGFTGQSLGPHLHFHLANQNFVLGAEGIPYHIEKYESLGQYRSIDFEKKKPVGLLIKKVISRNEFPRSMEIIRFNN